MLRAPLYEKVEYLNSFINYQDFIIIAYSVLIIFILKKIFLSTNNFKIIKLISILIFIILFNILVHKKPLSLVKSYINIYKDFYFNNKLITKRNIYLENLVREDIDYSNSKYNKIIIIQGESVNKHFIDKNSSPFISKLLETNSSYIFDIISGSNQTRYSIPMIFTKADVFNWKYNFIHSTSIITDFKDNGYKTYWISNQGHVGKHDDWISNIANEADIRIFFNKGNYTEAKSDNIIIKYLNNIETDKRNEMYIFHLIGSHNGYSKRYTQEHILYKNPEDIVQEYKNTIYFTDYVIKNIFNHFKNKGNILIIYISDHGEVVNNSKHGHGFLPPYKEEYQIPLIIYSSIQNDRLKKLYLENKKHFFNSENMNYFIKYISYLSDDINISTSSIVFSRNPKNQFDFNQLKSYE
jgi:glucan phosphoethanolaminetransferase (alkaline phosphatase superfamily)